MKHFLVVATLLTACMNDPTTGETESALTGDQVAQMNAAAAGTGITYSLPAVQTLAQVLAPTGDLKRTVRARRSDGSYIAEVIVPPDPLLPPDPCFGESLHLGPATTQWVPPDPCLPPDPCRAKFDVAGANFRVVGTGVEAQDGRFIVTVRVTDANGRVVFDSTH